MPVLSRKVLNSVSTMHQQVFPIQSLHPEILAEIFVFCLPEIRRFEELLEDSSISLIIGRKYAPLLLCNVCSSWRNLAISTPRLWQTLDFAIMPPPLNAELLATGIRTWLGRSGTLPLTIRLKVFSVHDWDLASQSWQILESIFQCAPRWERCHLTGLPKLPYSQSFGALPVLREIVITCSNLPGIPFTSAPCLKSLLLTSLPSTSRSSLSAIPWDQLTDLKIEQEQLPSLFLDIIRYCPRLQSLSLRLANPEKQVSQPFMAKTLGVGGSEVPSSFPITHDTLRCLHLSAMFSSSALLESIILPALIELKCIHFGFSQPPPSFFPQLLIFFTQSNCQLQHLSLVCPRFNPKELLRCLKHRCCQALTSLLIRNDGRDMLTMFNKKLLVHLTYSEDNKTVPICPKLAQLEFSDCYLSHRSSPDLLGRMIQSRCFGRAPSDRLKSFKISSLYPLSTEDNDLLSFAEEQGGLDLCMEYEFDESDSDSSDSDLSVWEAIPAMMGGGEHEIVVNDL